MTYTEDELAGLTEEERAALHDDETLETEEYEEDGQEQQGEQDEDESAEKGEEDAGDDAAEGADEGQQPADDGAGDGDDEPGPAIQQGPILVAEAPERAEERLKEIGDEKKSLRQQYDDGDLTFDEYESKVDALDDERMEIRLALKEAETAQKIEHQRMINEREAQINSFLAEVGVRRDFSDLRFAALDNAVKIVTNQETNASLGLRDILQKAYDLCVEQGVIQPKHAKNGEEKPEPRARKPIQTVPTLAKVPAAETTDTDEGNRFAWIDRLKDPVDRERALAKLSPADQEAYLAGA